ncbi:hypothetical protein HTG_18865 [Natrinema mahii]|nr:hypothetical protein HTG_18865 [Natrinema mahii]
MTSDSFTFAATGDAIIAPSVSKPENVERFDDLLNVLRTADAAVTQVEPVLLNEETPHAALRQVTDQYQYLAPFPGALIGTSPDILDELTEMGLNLFTAASNHSLDFGERGLRTTISAMRTRDLTFAGIGRDLTEASSPSYLDTDAGRVALLNATTSIPPSGVARVSTPGFDGTCGVNPLHVEWTYRMSPKHLEQLRTIASHTGIDQVKGEWLRRENSDWQTDDAYYFMQMRCAPMTEAQPPGIYHSLHERDRKTLLAGIEEAAATADWVVVALHSHQARAGNRNTKEIPQFLQQFAHECVKTGADTVVVTGPHALRGVEIHRERPIFYSLGNFFFHEDVIHRVPDSLDQTVDSTVPDVRGEDASSESDSTVTHDAENWMSIIPRCEFAPSGTLVDVTLHPCTLHPQSPHSRRGTPTLATGDEARDILKTVAERSAAFGTTIHIEEETGVINIP